MISFFDDRFFFKTNDPEHIKKRGTPIKENIEFNVYRILLVPNESYKNKK